MIYETLMYNIISNDFPIYEELKNTVEITADKKINIIDDKNNIKLYNPDSNIKDKFKQEISSTTKTIFISSLIGISFNQLLNKLNGVDQESINKIHVFLLLNIFITTILYKIIKNVFEYFKKSKLTINQKGILISVSVGTTIYLTIEKLNEYLIENGRFVDGQKAALISSFLTFLLNTNYIVKIKDKLLDKFNKK